MPRLTVEIVHRVRFEGTTAPDALSKILEAAMSKLGDKIRKLHEATDKAIARVLEDVAYLRDQIATLQEKVDNGTATDEEIALLDESEARLNALDPHKADTLPDDGTTPDDGTDPQPEPGPGDEDFEPQPEPEPGV